MNLRENVVLRWGKKGIEEGCRMGAEVEEEGYRQCGKREVEEVEERVVEGGGDAIENLEERIVNGVLGGCSGGGSVDPWRLTAARWFLGLRMCGLIEVA